MKSTVFWAYALIGTLIFFVIVVTILVAYKDGPLTNFFSELANALYLDQYMNLFD